MDRTVSGCWSPGALSASKDFLASVIDSIGEPTFVKDSAHRFVLANAAFSRFVGLPQQLIVGGTGEGYLSREKFSEVVAHDDRLFATGRPEVNELSLSNGSGQVRTVNAVMTTYTDQSGNKFLVGTFSDISARKEIEEQLADLAQVRADLVSLVNHEYANVLTNMKLALALLKTSDASQDVQSRAYEMLERAVESLRSYTANFLNLHRLESGKFQLNIQRTDIRAVVLESLVALRPLAEARRQKLHEILPEQSRLSVQADRECLAIIVNNLVTNAIKYTPVAGSITVRMTLEGQPPEQAIRLSVEDNGIGIDAADLKRIQEGFYRTQEGRRVAKGFGVGLRVVSEFLAKHGSRLEIESQPGQGARFSFRLPSAGGYHG